VCVRGGARVAVCGARVNRHTEFSRGTTAAIFSTRAVGRPAIGAREAFRFRAIERDAERARNRARGMNIK
jgi:hypothetical protein